MKVVIVALRYFGSGGAENVIRNLTSEIAKAKDIELSILTDNKYKGEIESWMNNVHTFNFFDLPILSFEFIQRLFPLKRVIDGIKPDLVHMHGCVVPIPKNMLSLMTVHGTYKNEIPYLLKHPISPLYRVFYSSLVYSQYLYEKHTYKFAKYYHAVSTQTKKELVEMGISSGKIFAIPNGVDVDKFYPKDTKEKLLNKLNLQENAKIVLHVGGIVPRKGIHVLIKSIPSVLREHHAHFIFVGGMPRLAKSYINYLNDLAKSLKVRDFVHFFGRVPDEELIDIYNACDLFVSPSYSEGYGLNILEAAACGKKVVATDAGGARDILGEYGYYVKPGNHIELARKIVRAMNEKANGEKMRSRIEKNFGWDKIARRVVNLYERFIEL